MGLTCYNGKLTMLGEGKNKKQQSVGCIDCEMGKLRAANKNECRFCFACDNGATAGSDRGWGNM